MMASMDAVAVRTSSAAVLLVDDTPSNLLALDAVLSPLAVRTVTARSGREALSHIVREPFAVALVDVQMPEMDGFELTRRLRETEHGRELPVLFVTAIHHDEIYVKKGYASGAADYITKPYDPDIIRARVKAFVDLYEQREAVRRGQVALRTQERDEAIRRLIAFERIATAALETSDLQALLDELLRAFTGAADAADSATILLRDGEWLKAEASVGLEPAPPLQVGSGFAGTIAAERRPMELSEAWQSPLVQNRHLREVKVRGLYGVPLLHNGEVLGVAHIGSTRASNFTDGEKRLFAAAAERAALAVARHLEVSRLHEILTAAPACIAIVQAPDYAYTFVNPAYASLFGPGLVGGRLSPAVFGAQALAVVEEVRRSGETRQLSEVPVTPAGSKVGQTRYMRFTAQALRNPSGTVGRVLIFAVDVTPQVLARREIEATQAARAELLERERTARRAAELASTAKDEFLATVSHELRTPLNAILGWASLARSKPAADMTRALNIIERNARAQASIVEDVLDFSRIARGKMRLTVGSVDLAAVVEEALEAVRPAAEAKGVDLKVSLAIEYPLIGDSDRIQQVVWNLLSNAVKFTSSGGHVTIRAVCGDAIASLEVCDSGQGIDSEFLPYIFEPFRQANGSTTRRHGGLGLGLAIVRQIVQAHGGTISANSDGAGKGTTFTVELPVDGKQARRPENESDLAPSQSSITTRGLRLDGLRILVVEDEDDSRELLSHLLAERGAKVRGAACVDEAMRSFEEFRPDVLVSDIAMPGADGYELIRWVRERRAEAGGLTPAVAVTAHAQKEARDMALAAGFQRHTAKPIDGLDLISAIAELGGITSWVHRDTNRGFSSGD